MEGIEEQIKANKPNISASSLKTYMSLLKNLYKKNKELHDVEGAWYNRQALIMDLIKDRPLSTRKTIYSALISVADNKDLYQAELLKEAAMYEAQQKEQRKTEVQEANWETYEQVKTLYEDMYKRVKSLLKRSELSEPDFIAVQDFIILSLTSGYWIPPRRSMDWTYMRLRNPNKEMDNFIEKGHFVFQTYKTSKTYKEQTVVIPKGLKAIINQWAKINKGNNMLVSSPQTPEIAMTNVQLTRRLNNMFGKKISTSMLRHIYLTEMMKDVPPLLDMEQRAKDMGHSITEAMKYVKQPTPAPAPAVAP